MAERRVPLTEKVEELIAAHAADASAHHARYTDAEALAAAIAGGLSKVIWKDASETALADLNRTETVDWTDLDLTAYTSSDAKFAILGLRLRADILGTSDTELRLRKKGTAPAAQQRLGLDAAGTTAGVFHRKQLIIGLDSGQVIEYTIVLGPGGWQVDSIVDVLGYIE